MSYFSKKDYKFVKFQKSNIKGKKYSAILQNKKTKRFKKLDFGASDYEHYRDTTGLGLWSHKNHNDKQRRKNYRARHNVHIKDGYYSPSYFSMYFLW